jgi:hypothetical protein
MHGEVPRVEATVKTVRALKEQYGDLHLAVGRRQQLKKWTQDEGGSQKKLAAAHRRMTRCAVIAPCKGHGHWGSGKDSVVQGTQKGQTFMKKCLAKVECNNGMRD